MNSKYGFGKHVNLPFAKAVERTTQALAAGGVAIASGPLMLRT